MGGRHAANLRSRVGRARLTAVADPDLDRAKEVAAPSGALVFPDGEELIASPEVDAVVIASPDPTHASLAIACLDHGKPALVEKPLATTVADAGAVVAREAALGRRLLQLGFMRRYDPQHVAVANAVRDGTIGRPLLFRGWHRNPAEPTPPSSADVLIKAAVHDLDSARWLLDDELAEITVRGTTIDPSRTDQLDLQLITAGTARGALAMIEVNKDSGFGYEVGVEITGSSGMISTPPHHTPTVRHRGLMRQRVEADWLERFAAAYIAEVQAWVGAARSGTATGPSAWDGYVSLAAAIAGVESIERSTPIAVELQERPALYS
jgi:myo-inositol 2-dehydrogenase/D-chiro-inositol 1-dehydrogenase